MAEERHCSECPLHSKLEWRVKELENDTKPIAQISQDMAVMQQQFKNLRYPIWAIFAIAVAKLGEAMIPTFKALAMAGGVQ